MVDVLKIRNGFHLGRLLCCMMFRCISAGVKGWLYFSELLDLKLNFCFLVLFLEVRKSGLELLMEKFSENVSANVSAMSFLVVASVLFL